jgi:hypothetical protein
MGAFFRRLSSPAVLLPQAARQTCSDAQGWQADRFSPLAGTRRKRSLTTACRPLPFAFCQLVRLLPTTLYTSAKPHGCVNRG